MSEQEFELYLKLLSRCLGLTPSQREHIADELRDHLEERLEELVREGVRRDQAVIQALDEFGDASALAAHFTSIARMRRRRLVMRLSLGSVAALAAGLFVALALWPEDNALQGPGPARVVAETTEAEPQPAPPVKVEVGQPIARDVADSLVYRDSLIEPSRKVEIRSRVSGYLNKVFLPAGGTVDVGQRLFSINTRPYETELARARAQLQQAQARAERAKLSFEYTEQLFKDKTVSDKEVRLRQFDWKETHAATESAQADLATAQIDLDYTQLTAPISGQLSRPEIDEGNLVTADHTVLATLTSVDPLTVKFQIEEETFLELRHAVRDGDFKVEEIPVSVASLGDSDFIRQARLDSLDGDLHGSCVMLRASLANPDLALVPGQQPIVRLTTGKPRPAMLVPLAAMGKDKLNVAPGGVIYVVEKDGAIRPRNVRIAGVDGEFAAIREGLQADEWVLKSFRAAQEVAEGKRFELLRTKFE